VVYAASDYAPTEESMQTELAAVAAVVVALCNGDYPIAPADVWAALTGHAPAFTTTVVVEWRLPRAVSAVVFGAALAVAGALVQSLTRNPLGSPDSDASPPLIDCVRPD
ncbi:iron chelate uptake ABC transporter family permease subunit, partial [Bacillus sp. S34]|nr:iron chelate uptake ABC transporter family permease subunit [Bacillus sp. S34]